MTKDELLSSIEELNLEREIFELIKELIDGSSDVNPSLLGTIADVLEQQADFYENLADVLDQEAEEWNMLADGLDILDQEEFNAKLEAIQKHQEEMLQDVINKTDTEKGNNSVGQQLQDQNGVEDSTSEIHNHDNQQINSENNWQ